MAIGRVILTLAEGGGTGRAPVAPGTVGSLPGLAWFATLLIPGNLIVFAAGSLLAVIGAVWICHRAEQLLQRKDPPSVVLDEIVAVPLACSGPWWSDLLRGSAPPGIGEVFASPLLGWTLAGFVLFRLLDALKPPPIHQCQRFPGGWGIVLDDVVAGAIAGGALCAARVWFS